MPVAPHYAARQQFLTVLNEFLARGCERWQRREYGWRSADELPPGAPVASLMVARFVKEQCEDASYKLWMGVRKGAEDAGNVALLSRRVFDQFLVRVRRCGDFTADDVEELRGYFNRHYWPIEEAWLAGRRTREERAKLFAELGGPAAVAAIKSDEQSFYEWSRDVISEAYSRNDYQRALLVSDAVVMESAALVGRDFEDRDVVLGLCAVQEAACVATMVRLNCWAPEPGGLLASLDEVAKRRVTAGMMNERERHDLGRFVTIATMLKAVCRRFENPAASEPSLAAIYGVLGYVRFHQGIRAKVASAAQCPVDSTTVTLMLSEAVSLRADWLRTFGLYGRMREVPDFAARAHAQLSAALGGEEEPGLVDATLHFMGEPHRLIDDEWSLSEEGIAGRTGWNDVALAVLGAKVWLQPDIASLEKSHGWLGRAKARLDGCGVHLAWSDFYCACDAYMQERGNPTLCDYALNSVRKLQRRAGNVSATEHYEGEVIQVASRRRRKPPAGNLPDDMDLQWFLREEPPPLSSRRGQRA